ncbi:hypothetical protein E2C01_097517 [Portunus trituberculatus]|uniref:Uncharacterized protein n=1 Tax=Portunus trituberculatus TaxID=210409 RepID=A0A5B7KBL6_PORTR|nr:hypothetical protein [Portunus trituberculatus]
MPRRAAGHPPHPPTPPPAATDGGRRGRVGWVALVGVVVVAVVLQRPVCAVPIFYESARMSALRLPETTEVGELIYQLRASYTDTRVPLLFSASGECRGGTPQDTGS